VKLEVTMRIRRVSDGEIATYRYAVDVDAPHEPSDFMYTEGNDACDCNRGLYFDRARGDEDANEKARGCGDSAYVLDLVEENGTVIIRDNKSVLETPW